MTPLAMRLDDALQQSQPLVRLQLLIRESKARFEAVRDFLPEPLMAHLKPGPLDDAAWTLLAANASVAAKLRQWQPALEARLQERGYPMCKIRVKVIAD